MKELLEMKVDVQIVTIGKKGAKYFKRRPQYKLAGGHSALPHRIIDDRLSASSQGPLCVAFSAKHSSCDPDRRGNPVT